MITDCFGRQERATCLSHSVPLLGSGLSSNVKTSLLMTASDDEYGFDDLVLDDRALDVLNATKRNLIP